MFEIGASLREARLKRGLSPVDVQKALRIRERHLQALEDERWELLPGEVYAKGFLRSYADYLGLDGNLYVDEYVSRFGTTDEPPLAPRRVRATEGDGMGVGLLRPLIAIAALVAIVAAVAAWQLDRGTSSAKPGTTTSTGTTTTTKHHHHRRPQVRAQLPTKAILVAARGACWLEIRSGSSTGTVVYENTLQQGKTLPVALTSGRVWITFGAPQNLDVRLGGKLVRGLPTTVGAAVLLDRRGLKPA